LNSNFELQIQNLKGGIKPERGKNSQTGIRTRAGKKERRLMLSGNVGAVPKSRNFRRVKEREKRLWRAAGHVVRKKRNEKQGIDDRK